MPLDLDQVEKWKREIGRPKGMPFRIGKLGHIVINVSDMERSLRFYTEIMGFEISDVYTEEMAPGGMAFLRCNTDHHSLALVGSMKQGRDNDNFEINHIAFEVPTLDEILRAREHLIRHNIEIDFDGRRRAGSQIAVEFRDPDNHRLEIFWGLDKIGDCGHVRPREEWKWVHSVEEAIADPCRGQDTTIYDQSLLRQPSAEELLRKKEHSLATQAVKLGTKR